MQWGTCARGACACAALSGAQDVKHHPASVDLELIKRLLATTKCKALQQFLAKEFSSISKEYAGGRRPVPPHSHASHSSSRHSCSMSSTT